MKTFSMPERKAARLLQGDIPLIDRPFKAIGDACGLSSHDVITWIQELTREGIIRKFSAILRHQKAGYGTNALVMWSVPPDDIERAGHLLSTVSFISHCYERKPAFQNKYNLFTMLHAQHDDISSLINTLSLLISSNDFLVLESMQEYKKTSPEYF